MGLIGDAWANGTPVLATKEHYDLKAGWNCLIVRSPLEFSEAVMGLQGDRDLWNQLSTGGLQTAKAHHSLELTAETLFEELKEVVNL